MEGLSICLDLVPCQKTWQQTFSLNNSSCCKFYFRSKHWPEKYAWRGAYIPHPTPGKEIFYWVLIILTKNICCSLFRYIICRNTCIILSCWALQHFFQCDIYVVEFRGEKVSAIIKENMLNFPWIDYGGFLGPPLPLFLWKPNQRQLSVRIFLYQENFIFISVADSNPDPPDPHVFGPPGSGSISQRYGSGSRFF